MNRKQRKAAAKASTNSSVAAVQQDFALALQHHNAGRLDEAEQLYRKILQTAQHAPSLSNMAIILKGRGRMDEAVTCYRKALALAPDEPNTLYNLGICYRTMNRMAEAEAAYRQALAINPTMLSALANLGDTLKTTGRPEEAAGFLRQALTLDPNHVEANYNLAVCLKDAGRHEEAEHHYARALAVRPDFFAARLSLCINRLPIIYHDAAEIAKARTSYREHLTALDHDVRRISTPAQLIAAAEAVGLVQPFYLAYQGENDRDLQTLYGVTMHRIMASRYPAWSRRPAMPPLPPGEKIRVGLLSGFFRHHSNWKIPIKGWVENLDRDRFRLFGYYTDVIRDDQTPQAERLFERFVQGVPSVEQWAQIIRNDDLHVLIVPEVGMDPMTVKLAALWLAPLQATSWGHPDTSGLPTMDYYLSSALMEPPGAEAHYSERLVRLPNLSIHYTPLQPASREMTRRELGVRDEAVMYWCCQSLFKYLPQFDNVFPLIAAQVPDAQFVFIRYAKGNGVNEIFSQRLKAAFDHVGLPFEKFCVFIPPMDFDRFNAATALADVFLDSIGWSGCNTTLEALALGKPVVTLPGSLMRGRHTLAILQMIGITETIASSLDHYVDIATRLGLDPAWRAGIAAKTAGARHRAYRDTACVRGLENFLEQAVRAMLPEA